MPRRLEVRFKAFWGGWCVVERDAKGGWHPVSQVYETQVDADRERQRMMG